MTKGGDSDEDCVVARMDTTKSSDHACMTDATAAHAPCHRIEERRDSGAIPVMRMDTDPVGPDAVRAGVRRQKHERMEKIESGDCRRMDSNISQKAGARTSSIRNLEGTASLGTSMQGSRSHDLISILAQRSGVPLVVDDPSTLEAFPSAELRKGLCAQSELIRQLVEENESFETQVDELTQALLQAQNKLLDRGVQDAEIDGLLTKSQKVSASPLKDFKLRVGRRRHDTSSSCATAVSERSGLAVGLAIADASRLEEPTPATEEDGGFWGGVFSAFGYKPPEATEEAKD